MPGAFETAIPPALPAPGISENYSPQIFWGQGHPSVQQQPSGFACELRDEDKAKAYVVVVPIAIGIGVVAVAVRRPAVLRPDNSVGIVPATAADNTIRTLDGCPISFTVQQSNFKRLMHFLPECLREASSLASLSFFFNNSL